MKCYLVKIRRYKGGTNGSTQYRFSTKVKAVVFAAGFQAGLHDSGNSDLYVSVWEVAPVIHPNSHIKPVIVMDSDGLKEIAEREY